MNASWRMPSNYHRLLGPEEMRLRPGAMSAPSARRCSSGISASWSRRPPPKASSRIDTIPFERRLDATFTDPAVILRCDGDLLSSRSGRRSPASVDDVEVVAGRADLLGRHAAEGWRLLGLSWEPDIGAHALALDDVDAIFARMRELLGVPIEVLSCPTPADRRRAGAESRCRGSALR